MNIKKITFNIEIKNGINFSYFEKDCLNVNFYSIVLFTILIRENKINFCDQK